MEAVEINVLWCKGCGVCVAFCPKKALSLVGEKAQVGPELCIGCGMCELYCPDLAIVVNKPTKKNEKVTEEGLS
jgi:2-oxoglutarate ferredoxin oxidoreductase subunit delta